MSFDAPLNAGLDKVQGNPETRYAVKTAGLSKKYRIYNQPRDRLFQMFNFTRKRFYSEFWALKDVSFTVRPGETIGIVGRNGSGKTTLLQLICGTLIPTSGFVEVNGRTAPLLELGSGFNPEYSGLENVYVNGAILGMSTEEIESKLESILAFANIGEFVHRPVKTYSSGMYVRLAFAVAIHTDPQILIIDEILAVGDAAFQRKCIQRFYELRSRGCTILFVSHDAYQVKAICQKGLYLSQGHAVVYGDSHEVVDRYVEDLLKSESEPESTASLRASDSKHPLQISRVCLENAEGRVVDQIKSGETLFLIFQYERLDKSFNEEISFVFNLYRQDGSYICGATTLMEHLPSVPVQDKGEVRICFPELPLTAGSYMWRVAINDAGGMMVHAQARYVSPFRVVDDFRSVGIVDLKRMWSFR